MGTDGEIFVLTRMPARVLVLDDEGQLLRIWGDGAFTDRAHGITVDRDGNVYCVDDGAHVVKKFSSTGELLLTLGREGIASNTGYDGRSVGSITAPGDPFNRPTNVAIGFDGDVFVTDGYGNCRVHVFSTEGELKRSWGAPGAGPGKFNLPHGIAVAPDGNVLVADRENERIQVFSPDGRFVSEWLDVQRPTQIAVDASRGLVLVAELGWRADQRSFRFGSGRMLPSRVSVLTLDGKLVERYGDVPPCDAGGFIAAHGIAVGPDGSVYVAEVAWTIAVSRGEAPESCHTLQRLVPAM